METIQICDPASDKTITQERSLSIRKSTNRPKVTKGWYNSIAIAKLWPALDKWRLFGTDKVADIHNYK